MGNLIENKKVFYDYELLREFEAGIVLSGFEVKSVKKKNGSLAGAYVVLRGGELFLVGVNIGPYQANNTPKEYDQVRPRKLLVTRKELKELVGVEKQKGLTIVPISMYNKGNLVKVRIAIAKGKKKYDKRETIKKRDVERDIGRTLKR